MTDAFMCDHCEEFYRGEPTEKLYTKIHYDLQGTEYGHRADLCAECSSSFAGGPDDE